MVGWGWGQDDPELEANMAVQVCRQYGLDGYILNAEDPYEGPANYWKSAAFTSEFRRRAPNAPLALSYIGFGNPHRDLMFRPWIDAGAAFMPQCYWATEATSIYPPLWAAGNVPIPRGLIVPTLGTSGFATPYDPNTYRRELFETGARGHNVWLLDSTTDDVLRAIGPAIR